MKCDFKLREEISELLCCPVCKSELKLEKDGFCCISDRCHSIFPMVDGIPVLINESNSIFSLSDFERHRDTYFKTYSKSEKFLRRFLPAIDQNLKAEANLSKFAGLILRESTDPKVLILGGSKVGRGLKDILSHESIRFVETDVSFGPRTTVICDVHDIPFRDETFDGVIAQAVLEHVVDPYRCVEEIFRVLKKKGIVYAETAFMQYLHGGRYDFTRFTHLGHRRLFRRFDEICSGAEGGAGMSLAWAYRAFLLSFVSSRLARAAIKAFARYSAWELKYIDYYLINKPGTLDAAFEYSFMGRKSDKIISDKEIIKEYRGTDEH